MVVSSQELEFQNLPTTFTMMYLTYVTAIGNAANAPKCVWKTLYHPYLSLPFETKDHAIQHEKHCK